MDISNSNSKEAIEPQPPTTSQTSDTSPPTIQAVLNPEDDFALSEMASEIPDNGSDDEDFSEQLVKEPSETVINRKQDASKKDIKELSDDSTEKELQQQISGISRATGGQQSPTEQQISAESERSSLTADEQDPIQGGKQLSGGKKSLDEKPASSGNRLSPTKVQQVPIEESEKESPAEGDKSSQEVLQESSEMLEGSLAANADIKVKREQRSAEKESPTNDDSCSKELEHQKSPESEVSEESPRATAQQDQAKTSEPISSKEKEEMSQPAQMVKEAPITASSNEVETAQQNSSEVSPVSSIAASPYMKSSMARNAGKDSSSSDDLSKESEHHKSSESQISEESPRAAAQQDQSKTVQISSGEKEEMSKSAQMVKASPATASSTKCLSNEAEPTQQKSSQVSSTSKTIFIPGMKNDPIVAAKQSKSDSIKITKVVKVGNTLVTVNGGGTSGPAKQILSSGTVTPIVTKGGTSGPAKPTMTPIVTKGGTSEPAMQVLSSGTVTPIATKGGTSVPAKPTMTPIVTKGRYIGTSNA
ncbi:uncharacterized protein [Amphiura filiformis]|uniref:uncharacterized protein isoform X2 n=1 Tax=Amphiura filiformis TaxID=82378 RepID=UPI003B2204FA